MSLPAGTRLGQYEILAQIGAGGMGQVYRAHDSQLDREVAIKILSPQLARDPEALARFEREALSVAKLSHPNILAIYELGRDADTVFVVSELVDGETLRARLAGGPLSPRRAAGYGQQVARGMAAAHARGIVHRDLKPENVMITRDDHVKILDFGLAKSIGPSGSDETRMVAGRTSIDTSVGTILGTFGYMAPEQVRGLAVDHRSDIFSFGAMLYEMLSGERAFKGETAADTMSAILTREPPGLDVTRLAISPSLERIVHRCLEKTPELRFQSANDLAFALETLSTTSSSSGSASAAAVTTPAMASVSNKTWLPWSVAAVAIVAAAAAWIFKPEAPRAETWQQFTPVTEASGEETAPALSPDGSSVAYAIRVNGSWDIYGQRVGGRNATPIVNDPQRNEGGPAYSPDGSQIAFHQSDGKGGIFIAGATGESVRRLTDAGFDPAWSPDGTRVAFADEEIHEASSRVTTSHLNIVAASGGAPSRIAVEGDAVQPSWSPSGKRIVYWSNTTGQRDLFTVAVDGGTRVALTNDASIDWCPVWSGDGRFVYFASDRGGATNIWRIPVDESTGGATGAPEPVTNGVQASAVRPRFSKDGSRMAFRSAVKSVNPVAIPFDPVTARAGTPIVLDASNNIRIPSDVSPDGRQLAFFSIGERQEDAFIGGADGKGIRRVTDDAARDRGPMFTHDGKSLVFYSNREGRWEPWSVRADGGNLRKIAAIPGCIFVLVSTIDDTVVCSTASGSGEIFIMPLNGDPAAPPTKVPNTRIAEGSLNPTSFSPDGTRLAGLLQAPTGPTAGVAVYDLRAHALTMITADDNTAVRWLPDNRRLIYFTAGGSQLVVVDTVTRQRTVVDVRLPGPSVDDMFAISRDGRMIYYGAARAEADIWIAERKK